MPTLAKIARWLAGKLATAALIVVLALAAVGGWLFLKDTAYGDRVRLQRLEELGRQRDQLQETRARLGAQLEQFVAETRRQQERVEQARRVISVLRDLESWWERMFGNPAQQAANAEQRARMERLESESSELIAMLKRRTAEAVRDKNAVENALTRVGAEIRHVEESRSAVLHYAERAWREMKWALAAALLAFFLGPTLWALLMYYGFGRFVGSGRPIQLAPEPPAEQPVVGESRVSLGLTLRAGEVLRTREKFLQASDEGVTKQTRFVLDWRIPFTSLACGLVELVELRAAGAGEYQVTLSNADDPHVELAALDLPAGASLILRPSYLAAVILPEGAALRIDRHWQLARWQSWVAGQFRFFEFVGPCRLMVAGSRGVRAERLGGGDDAAAPARRVNQDATIGFTPNLAYRPVRAETFWSYYRGMNPLFDDVFAGHGVFLLQETSTPGGAAKAGRFWAGVWNGVLKVFGL